MTSLTKSDIIRAAERRFKGRISPRDIREFFDFLDEKIAYGLRDKDKVSLGFVICKRLPRVLSLETSLVGPIDVTKDRLKCYLSPRMKRLVWKLARKK